MTKLSKPEWKALYFDNLSTNLLKYNRCFIVGVDNVRSNQMQKIRAALRGQAVLVMGKNTMIRRVINQCVEKEPMLEKLLPHIKENVGFVFTDGDLNEIRDAINVNVVAAPAKAGAIAPVSVTLPKQNTGLGPEKTNFFQALNIATKITRGTIEIVSDIDLIKVGDKVGASEATLLNMLKISPFTYGLTLKQVYEHGSCYDPAVLDITPEAILDRFMSGVRNVAAASLALNYPNAASIPHLLINGFKNLLAVSVETDYTFAESEKVKEYLANPSAFAAASAAPAAAAQPPKEEAKKAEAKEESDDDSDASMGMGLFD